jgi:hypothetical protein
MKKTIAVTVTCLMTSLALTAAAQDVRPLNAKTGLWQMTETINWTGLPPQYAAAMRNGQSKNYTSCVKTKDLSSNPWAGGSRENCVWTVLKSTGTDMEVQGTSCDMGKEFGMTSEVHGTIHVSDSEDGSGSFVITLTGNGQSMHGRAAYTGKWTSASCGAKGH